MLRGARHPQALEGVVHGVYDLTGYHTALLWAGSTIVTVGESSFKISRAYA